MSAFLEAYKSYDPSVMVDIILMCSQYGFVLSEPGTFVCAYPVMRQDLNTDIEIQSKKGLDECDTWFVYIASGNMKTAIKKLPEREYIAFERFDNKTRVYRFDRIRRLYGKQ